jgi:hypothetical protein
LSNSFTELHYLVESILRTSIRIDFCLSRKDEVEEHLLAQKDTILYSKTAVSYFEVAHGDTGEVARVGPVYAGYQVGQDLCTPVVEVGAQEGVEQDKLQDTIDDEENLHHQVSDRDVRTDQARCPSENIIF